MQSPDKEPERLSVSSVQFSSVAQSCLTLCDPMKGYSILEIELIVRGMNLICLYLPFNECCALSYNNLPEMA